MRLVGALIAVALVVGGFAIGRKLEADAAAQNALRARDRAERIGTDAANSLERQLALFQVKAQGAASNPAIHSLVRGGVDQATFHDGLSNEQWSSSYREHGGSSAVFVGETKAGASATLLSDDTLKAVALDAQAGSEASKLVPLQGLYLVAAVRLPFDATDGRKVAVVLARPLAQAELDALSSSPLLLSDGKQSLGAREGSEALARLIGREAEAPLDLDGTVALARPLGTLWVWTLQPVTAEVQPLLPAVAVWGGGLLLGAAVAAFSALGRKKAYPIPLTQPMVLPGSKGPQFKDTPSAAFAQTSPAVETKSRYVEVAPLGEGGMAKVSLAVTHGAEGFKRHFVVKRLKRELTANPELVAQFIDEARLGASLVHSNVVPVFDFGRDEEGYFIAQEYIMGRDLESLRRALFETHRATLDLPLVLYVAQETLKALSYAHGKTDDTGKPMGLVHRDVSPNNLMLSARGELKLLDFGIVKAEGKLSHTQTGMIKGNVFYMSPEQARGLPVDRRADLFSLGLVLFTASAGETLYRGTSNYDLLTRAAEGLSQAEWERVGRLPEALATLLGKALQFDPAKRFQSAEEFAHALPAGQIGSAVAMQQLMEALFKDDFARERSRFSGVTGAAT